MRVLRETMRLPALELRVGLHSGPVISGMVDKHKFMFDIWGDAVNIAALMEADGQPGRINVFGDSPEGRIFSRPRRPDAEPELRGRMQSHSRRIFRLAAAAPVS